ncbi:hypothetical protein [Mycobacterium avium]|uniref:hypothetical protein n=1 Tax=Mycobacterium avium TaxID=1764 RepID=UPI0009FD8F38|nr:hypothetical protein [Mycobacterium avium]
MHTNRTTRCAECRLVRRNERLDTPALKERREQLLAEVRAQAQAARRRSAVQERLYELDAETATERGQLT